MADRLQKKVFRRRANLDEKDDNSKSNKGKKRKQEEPSSIIEKEDHEHVNSSCLQRISTCFGVNGVFNNKKSKIENKTGALEILSKDWIGLENIKELSLPSQKRYIEILSEETLKLLVLMKETISFYKMLQGKEKKQFKRVSMDLLLKDLKVNTTVDSAQRYIQMGLWREIMRVNQEAFQNFDKFINAGTDSSKMQIDAKNELKENTSEQSKEVEKVSAEKEKTFRDFYMDVVTSSFANDLDRLREQSEMDGKQVGLLIDCLEAGKDIWTHIEKKLFQSSFPTQS